MQYGIREDGSTKHILSFDAETGAYIENFGGQGYSAESSWSRGTAGGCTASSIPIATVEMNGS